MGVHPHPTEIRYIEDEDLLKITFSDGEAFDYETPILRGYCPCAHCQGHGSLPHVFNPIREQSQITVDDISQVGGYAICIAWGDGHNTGVYSFELLRKFAEEPESILEDYPPDDYWADGGG